MYPTDYEANKNTEESFAQILASYRQKELESKKIANEKNKKAVAKSKQKKIKNQITLANKVTSLEEKKLEMSHKIASLKEDIKVLMDNNKELKNGVYVTKYLEAEFQRLQMTLEIQQQMVATAEQIYMPFRDTNEFPYQPYNNLQQTNPTTISSYDQQQANQDYLDQFGITNTESMNPNMFHYPNNDHFNPDLEYTYSSF